MVQPGGIALMFAAAQINQDSISSERSQPQKATGCAGVLIWNIYGGASIEQEKESRQ